jgi:hypothetical protein
MKWFLVAGAVLLVASRYPTLVEYGGLVGLVAFIAACCANNRAPSKGAPGFGGGGWRPVRGVRVLG